MTDRADNERYVNLARRWFSEGWARNIALAGGLFSENVRTNGVLVGKAGAKRRIQEWLAGFPISPRPTRICSQLAIRS
jgi:hypothetical protein